MELVSSTIVAFLLLLGATATACPLEIDELRLVRAEASAKSSPASRKLVDEIRPHVGACFEVNTPEVERALKLFVTRALLTQRPDDLKLASTLVEKKLSKKRTGGRERADWRTFRVRIRAARGHEVFAELETLYGRGVLSGSPESLQLLATARRTAGDMKGAGKIAVEARMAERNRNRLNARLLGELTAKQIRDQFSDVRKPH